MAFSFSKGGRKRGRETSMCGCLSCAPYWEPGPQPRHLLWLGIEPATLWFASQHSIHWATPARTRSIILNRPHWKLSKCPPTNKQRNNMWYIHRIESYSTIKRSKLLINPMTWMNLGNVTKVREARHELKGTHIV